MYTDHSSGVRSFARVPMPDGTSAIQGRFEEKFKRRFDKKNEKKKRKNLLSLIT